MTTLSSPHHDLQSHYPIVVIGSGYGGSIAASRLARAGKQVCLLERGKEFQVGEYPDNELSALSNLQIEGIENFKASGNGLYHIYYDSEISAFVGCGLGGTSLVNANVCLRADSRVFDDASWPKALQNDVSTLLEESYSHAEAMLKPKPYPESFPPLAKLQALEKAAQSLHEPFYRPPIAVNFDISGDNHVGVFQKPCQLCGDCVSGCNYAAKNTLIMNYLPDAKNHGAEIFTEILVLNIEHQQNRFIIYYQDLSLDGEAAKQIRFISADLVVLAGGTFGSTEILLRSKAAGLGLSNQIGHHFTGNGDVLAFGYNLKDVTNGIGYGAQSPQGKPAVGPCITGIIDMRNQPNLDDGLVIEEGAIPGGMAGFLPKIFAISAKFAGIGARSTLEQNEHELASLVFGAYSGAVNHTLTFLVMAHDNGDGKLLLNNDRLQITWPNVGSQPVFTKINEALTAATAPLGGTFIPNPVWHELAEHTLVTVHPLGGCIMAETAEKGVVNHKGQLFSDITGTEVYENLYVLDGSIIPRSLGVNPLLTISALAERAVALIAEDRDWTIDYAFSTLPKTKEKSLPIGLEFTETMRGKLSTRLLDDYLAAYNDSSATPFEFTLTIHTSDLQAMLNQDSHEAKITGEVSIPAISKKPLMVSEGLFNLFVDDPKNINTRKMLYKMILESVEGKRYLFEGYKLIKNDSGADIWEDTTTLYVTLTDITAEKRICAKGILKILAADFMHQLTTLRILNSDDQKEILTAKVRFGNFFAGTLYQIYGGIFAKTNYFNPEALPREMRKLRVGQPSIYYVTTADQQQLRLTQYKGGDKGPVILSHGLGVSSLIFAIDTIDTNLLEYLFAHGYDVWLLDYRASIDLSTANTYFSGDEIALYDYPAAVKKVLEVTKAKDVQMVAHCFGATTLCMSMLAGLQNVRSIVFSQIAAHMVVLPEAKIKAGLYLPSFLKKLGVTSLTAYADTKQDWQQNLFDSALSATNLTADEPCQDAVCRRITFLYGQLYEHAKLNQATHNALHEMFGLANIKSFEHLALMVRRGHLVNAEGEESYMEHLKRLALPITFIHGIENHCFLPQSTAITYRLLQEKNGNKFYTRHLIPNYGHIDCIFGQNAVSDVYPYILKHLEAHAKTETASFIS